MNEYEEDFDYSGLAGLRGVTVILRDVKIFRCVSCVGSEFVEICRFGPLTRELAAAKCIHVKRLWCSFRDNEWAIAFTPAEGPIKRPKRRGKSS